MAHPIKKSGKRPNYFRHVMKWEDHKMMLIGMTASDATKLLDRLKGPAGAGDLWAIRTALCTCEVFGCVPPWLFRPIDELIVEQILGKRRRGRAGNYLAAAKQHKVHLMRWATVKHLRENCRERAPTWDVAYREAARELRGTIAQGSEELMRASYKFYCRHPLTRGGPNVAAIARQYYEERALHLDLG